MLKAATRNIAVAYGKGQELGAILPGFAADLVILDENPLQGAKNYRRIHAILKDGVVVDREALPVNPILTRPIEAPTGEEASYRAFLSGSAFPLCPMCSCH
jgi:predicted amidohydrolase YtcJ